MSKKLKWTEDKNGHLVAKGKHNYLIDQSMPSLYPLYSMDGDKHKHLLSRRTIPELQALAQDLEEGKEI